MIVRLIAMTACCIAGLAACAAPQTDEPWMAAPPLRDAFKGKFLIGAVLSNAALRDQAPMDVAIACRHFSAFTCENGTKPDATEPEQGRFTFELGDRLVDLARKCGATPTGHCLVWHSQTPRWYFQGPDGAPAGRDLVLQRMREHIAGVVGHFKGRIKQWDVVNEAISDSPDQLLRPSAWQRAIGDDFIAQAFRAAHAADPKAMLVYNDYNVELPYKRPKALKLLKSLLDDKVPIGAVGIQCHWRLGSVNLADVEDSIRQYAALGLKVVISEMDVGVLPSSYQGADVGFRARMTPEQRATMNPYTTGLPDDVAKQQADLYRQAFEMFLRHRDAIVRVTLWGVQDGGSWLNGFPIPGRTDYPLLFDRQGKPKPAFFAVRDAARLRAGS